MPRKVVPPNSELPYHVSGRCNNREWFDIPMPEVWSIMEDYLSFISHAFELEIISFVLMNNHFHLLVRAPKANLAEAMNYFMRETSRQIACKSKRINIIYGGRFHRTLIDNNNYFLAAYKYVYRNPIEAGLCKRVGDYPYSTLNRKLGRGRLNFPIAFDVTLYSSFEQTLKWLSEMPAPDDTEQIRKALKKSVFEIAADRNSGKASSLKDRLY